MEKTRLPFERLGSTVVFPRTSTNIDSTRICIHDIGRGRRKKFKVTPPDSTPKSNQPSEKKNNHYLLHSSRFFLMLHLWSPGFWDMFLASLCFIQLSSICSEQLHKTPAGPLVATWYKPTLTVSPLRLHPAGKTNKSQVICNWMISQYDICLSSKTCPVWAVSCGYIYVYIEGMPRNIWLLGLENWLEKLLLQEILKNVGCICQKTLWNHWNDKISLNHVNH